MQTDEKCELASAIVDYIWRGVHQQVADHSYTENNGDVRYVDEAQDIFNNVLDIIDEYVKE
jgi:hypothetical protein